MPENIAAVENNAIKSMQQSVLNVVISDHRWNNEGLSEINEHLYILLKALRGEQPCLVGEVGGLKAPDDGHLNALKSAVLRHAELNNSIREKLAEIDSLLS